jgi:phenylalanyl-tRNA synthetase beta chain
MPSISFSKKDFETLVGKKFSKSELEFFLTFAKAEIDGFEGDNVSVGLDDTNQPALWSVEGLARLARGVYDVEKGIPKISVSKSDKKIIVEKGIEKVRPFISCFVAKGKKIDDFFLKQLIQLQEKIAENFGKKRKKLSVGIYPGKKIVFPVKYSLVSSDRCFRPLDFEKECSISEILSSHPKAKEYAFILEGCKKFPVLLDSAGKILSLAPIINSEETGRLDVGDNEIFFDCTGDDRFAVDLVANIFAQALFDRGFKLFSCEIVYPDEKVFTPSLKKLSVPVVQKDFENLIGDELSVNKIKDCLRKMRCDYKDGKVVFPCFRADVMHKVDAIEEAAIGFGFDNLSPLSLSCYSKGSALPKVKVLNIVRDLIVGLGFQEVFSMILSNKNLLYEKMYLDNPRTVEIDSFLSENYSVVRTSLIPILLDMLAHNKHQDYPQKVFEQGIVTLRNSKVVDEEHIAVLSAHPKSDFTEARQIVEYLLSVLDVDFIIKEVENSSFIPGRCAEVLLKNKDNKKVNYKKIGVLGELHPKVLSNFSLLMPVCAFELNLNDIIDEKCE